LIFHGIEKKKEEVPTRVLLGRPSNNLSMGIVGIPNVGKSTLFNLLTKLSVPAENYPFCTIDPTEARVAVPDARFDFLCGFHKPASKVAASLTVIDIAGLIKGASTGEGLGNAFLSHIKATDGIYHVMRIFEDEDITHVEGNVDPLRDIEVIIQELMNKDVEQLIKIREGLGRQASTSKDKVVKLTFDVATKSLEYLENKVQIRFGEWKVNEIEILNTFQLLTAKPVVYLINMSEADFIKKKNKWLPKIKQWVDSKGGEPIVPFSGALESKLHAMEVEADRKKYETDIGVTSAISKIIRTGYHALELIHFFTCGSDEVKCWTIRNGAKAPQAAGVIHTDFERGFICAEVMKYDEFKELGSESAVKTAGKYRQEGKTYVVIDGDIIFFRFNVSGGGKK